MSKYWKHNDNDNDGCAMTIFGILLMIGIGVFLGPWIVMHAWNLIVAGMFAGPTIGYWAAFWGTLAVHCLFPVWGGHSKSNG